MIKNIKLTPDSLRYGLVSQQILTGHGIRLPVTRLLADNMESVLPNRMSEFGSRILVLFSKVEAQYDGNYVAELFNKRGDDDKFGLVHECQDGVVYKTIK